MIPIDQDDGQHYNDPDRYYIQIYISIMLVGACHYICSYKKRISSFYRKFLKEEDVEALAIMQAQEEAHGAATWAKKNLIRKMCCCHLCMTE